jgi:hypothetical protein
MESSLSAQQIPVPRVKRKVFDRPGAQNWEGLPDSLPARREQCPQVVGNPKRRKPGGLLRTGVLFAANVGRVRL